MNQKYFKSSLTKIDNSELIFVGKQHRIKEIPRHNVYRNHHPGYQGKIKEHFLLDINSLLIIMIPLCILFLSALLRHTIWCTYLSVYFEDFDICIPVGYCHNRGKIQFRQFQKFTLAPFVLFLSLHSYPRQALMGFLSLCINLHFLTFYIK